jgi:hypothetical protein
VPNGSTMNEMSLLSTRLERPPLARASVYPLVGVVRLPKTLAESKLAEAPALAGRQSAEVDPSPDGVVTDPQQLTCLTDPHRWHQ